MFKHALKTGLRPLSSRVNAFIAKCVPKLDLESSYQQMQRSLVNQYALYRAQKFRPYQNIKDAGFRVYSQFEEDGIILYILSMIGFKTRRVVEMCCGAGDECMATNLILNHGFEGFLFDSAENIGAARTFFATKPDCVLSPPILTGAWITAENVNDLLIAAGCTGEIDLLSLDLDGNDYWILNAITCLEPRLIIAETHCIIPGDKSITIEYDPAFSRQTRPEHEWDYAGASLLAMQRLCRRRGYRMIGAHRHGFNVLFLRNGEGEQFFPEVSIEQVHDNPCTRLAQRTRWPLVAHMPWKEVDGRGAPAIVCK